MREARFDPVESDRKQVSRFSLWSSIILMAAILAVAGIVSALTAMRSATSRPRSRSTAAGRKDRRRSEGNSQSQWFVVEGVNFTLQFDSAGRTYSGSDSAFRKPAQN